MKTRFALFLVSMTLFASSAHAWEPIYSTRPVWRLPVPYSINNRGSADLGGFAASEAEARRAMDDWTLVSCTALTTNYQGSTSAMPTSYEGISVIGWLESGWPHTASAIGVTGPSWGSYIIESDMALNGVNYTWTTSGGTFNNVNAYSIVLHEGGHYYGLGHSNVPGSSMWPSYSGGIVGLASDDEAGICALYPGTGSDCTTTGCPSGQECIARVCQTASGDGNVCSPCGTGADCTNGLCLGYPDGGGYCGRGCGSDADCAGDTCVPTSGGYQCVRFDDATGVPSCEGATPGCTRDSDCSSTELCSGGTCIPRPTGGTSLGGSCSTDTDCNSRLCIGGICTQSCNWLDVTSCPAGFYCDADASTSCDTGYCAQGTAGSAALGAVCSGDQQCASLHCDGGLCSQPCIPGGAAGCPDDYACQVGTLPCRGSCKTDTGSLGDPCQGNEGCTSGQCAAAGERTFCTRLCDGGNPCPAGFTCQPAGMSSVCAPNSGALGESCANNDDCLDSMCASQGGVTFCTRFCDTGTNPCPASYECLPTADPSVSVCRPTMQAGGCGCHAVSGRSAIAPILAFLALAGFLVRRRRPGNQN